MTIAITSSEDIGAIILQMLDELACISESQAGLRRRCFTPEHRKANDLVSVWMRKAGMTARQDAMGNVIGRYEGTVPGAPALLVGSHLDTVDMAGKYDGMLGVVAGIECVGRLHQKDIRFPFAVEIIGFCDEEGARFGSTYLGSRAVTGSFDETLLARRDKDGVSLEQAMRTFGLDPADIKSAARSREDVIGYLELHIEQGPVLEAESLSTGCVSAISGTTRAVARLGGQAGHAGTVPMRMRRDALATAAECIGTLERIATEGHELVCTVGSLTVSPGSINVIPGAVEFTIDLRSPDDNRRFAAETRIQEALAQITERRGVSLDIEKVHEAPSVQCSARISDMIREGLRDQCGRALTLPSGAGHDAAAMVELTEIGMIFVRCAGGISHSPDESITCEDAAAGANLLLATIQRFA